MEETSQKKNRQESSGDPAADSPSRWNAVIILSVVLIAIAFSQSFLSRGGEQEKAGGQPRHEGPIGEVVLLAVDRSEPGSEPFEAEVAWRKGMTALEALVAVLAEGVDRTGEGGQAFVHAIDGLANEGGDGRNWQYYVNGEHGKVSAGAQTLEPNDRVLWKFAPYE